MTQGETTILYWGIFDPEFSRNAVYVKGLKSNGVEVIVCTDRSPGLKKYLRIIAGFWKHRKDFDMVFVGYSGHPIVPLAKLLSLILSRKPVVFDALCSFYESNILSRDAFKSIPFRKNICRFVDFVANASADYILVETEAQRDYYVHTLGVTSRKCIVALTGVDDTHFYYDPAIAKSSKFTVLFRGKFTPEAGIPHILEAAQLLQNEDVAFKIIGFGWGTVARNIEEQVKTLNLKNLEFINTFLSMEELRGEILKSHISLGQFENHDRLNRTIPHKAFEAMAMKVPYITARAKGIGEVLTDNVTCIFVHKANPQDLAEKILSLKNDTEKQKLLSDNAYAIYIKKYTPEILARKLLGQMRENSLNT
ncbi:MAG: glycosyltransferase [Patescibacteria group bacterium]